nr:MAG TPA: hypothetical protein [Caudoviricetes sp.]
MLGTRHNRFLTKYNYRLTKRVSRYPKTVIGRGL